MLIFLAHCAYGCEFLQLVLWSYPQGRVALAMRTLETETIAGLWELRLGLVVGWLESQGALLLELVQHLELLVHFTLDNSD